MNEYKEDIRIAYSDGGIGKAIEMKLRGIVTIVIGDSGTGKTYLASELGKVISEGRIGGSGDTTLISSNIDLNRIKVFLEDDIATAGIEIKRLISEEENNIIVIDELMNSMDYHGIWKMIKEDLKNTYVLIFREGLGTRDTGASVANIAHIETSEDNTKISLGYKYDLGGW